MAKKTNGDSNAGKRLIIDLLDPYRDSSGFGFYRDTKISEADLARDRTPARRAVPRVYYKSYPRLPQIILKNQRVSDSFVKTLLRRHTTRAFGEPLSRDDLAYILKFSAGTNPRISSSFPKRTYPSAGARYPIETYVFVQSVKGLATGIYHYSVKGNSLELLTDDRHYLKRFKKGFVASDLRNVSAVLVLTAVFERNISKYGERGFRHVFFECGHLAQNIYLLCAHKNLACRSMGGFSEDVLVETLDIFERTELPLYTIAIGKES